MRSLFIRVLVTLAILLTLSSAVHQSNAQTAAAAPKTVTYDTPVDGQITDQAIEEDWTLVAPGKDLISITVQRTGGTLVPYVQLLDPNHQQLMSTGEDNTYAQAKFNYTLPNPGTYIIAVGRYADKIGKTSGNYKLTVKLDSAGADDPSAKPTPGTIDYTKPVAGEITNAKWHEFWTFKTTSKDWVTIDVKRTDGTLYPRLNLLDGSGNVVDRGGLNDNYDESIMSHYQLPGVGQYTIEVIRDSDVNGATVGKYSLSLTLDGTGPEQTSLLTPVGPLAMDTTINGELTDAKWVDVYTLDAKSKDRLTLKAVRTSGNLFPTVYLFGANDQEIERANTDNTGAAAQLDVTLPGPGKYSVRVQRYGNDSGETAGKYELDAILRGIGEDNPSLAASAGEVKIGTPAKGTLTNAKWQDTWTLNVTSKDPIDIILKRTSGTLIPVIVVNGANNQEINQTGQDDTYATATLNQFTLPGPGQYTVIVQRYSKADGETSGAYELDVNQGVKQ